LTAIGGELMVNEKSFYPFKYKLSILLFSVVLLVSAFLGTFQYLIVKRNLEESFEQSKALINDRVINMVYNADYINSLIEAPLEKVGREVLESVIQEYERTKSIDMDLADFIKNYDNINLYIIDERNVVIAATDELDIGLDFTPWTDFVEFLDSVRDGRAFKTSRMSLSLNEGNMTKYCYMPTSDGKYIFETGSLIKEEVSMLDGIGFDNFEERLVQDNPIVDKVILYDYEGVAYKKDASGEKRSVDPEHMKYFQQAIESMEAIEVVERQGDSTLFYQYIPYQIIGAEDVNTRNVIEIVYNSSMLVNSEKMNIRQIFIVTLIAAGLAASYGFFNARIITKPIEQISESVKKVSEGDFDTIVEINSNDEFSILGDKFNNMTLEIKKLLEERRAHVEALEKKNLEIYSQKEEIAALYEETNALYEETTALNEELESLLKSNENSYFETVRALANAIEEKDSYTGGHCERVMKYSMMIADELGLTIQEQNDLKFGSILHDIGKIGISEAILNKEGLLTAEEYEEIKQHPVKGYRILENLHFLDGCRKIVYEHHERIDSKGYPNGLNGNEINLLARIVCVVDAYDAMTSTRPYRKQPMQPEEAVMELKRNAGKQFDERIVDAFVRCLVKENIIVDSVV
jgi:putative nucleotidyltransferase with HDIG domain